MYRTMYLKDFGRYVSAFVTREKTGALVVGARTGYTDQFNGDVIYAYLDKQGVMNLYYNFFIAKAMTPVVSETNFDTVFTHNNTIVFGSPKQKSEKVSVLNQSVCIVNVVESPRTPFFLFFPSTYNYIPAPSKKHSNLGASAYLGEKYLLYSDPVTNRGTVFVAKRNEVFFDYVGQLNPLPQGGAYQKFGEHLAMIDKKDGNTDIYITASTAWIHSNSQKAVNGTTEIIGVVYEFEVVNSKCYPKNYYVVKTPHETSLMNSTISGMIKNDNNVYLTLYNFPGLYRINCDMKTEVFY